MTDDHRRTGTASHRSVVLVVADDRLLVSHALPAMRAAVASGLTVTAVAPDGAGRSAIEAAGLRVVPLDLGGSSLNPMTSGYAAGQLSGILKALKADLLHAIGLRAILVGGSAAAMAGIAPRLYAPADHGTVGEATGALGRASRLAARTLIRGPLASGQTRYLFEDVQSARLLGLDPADVAVTIAAGEPALAEAAVRVYAELLPP